MISKERGFWYSVPKYNNTHTQPASPLPAYEKQQQQQQQPLSGESACWNTTFQLAVHHFFNPFSRSFVLIYYQLLGAPQPRVTVRPGEDFTPRFEEAWKLI